MTRHSGAQYTLTTPAGSLVFNPTSFSGDGYFLDYDGMQFGSDVRSARVSRPQSHGSYQDSGFEDGAIGVIKGVIIASTLASRATLEQNLLKCVRSTLGSEGTGTLSWSEPGSGEARQLRGLQLAERVQLVGTGGSSMAFQIMLQGERSTAELAAETSTDSSSLSTDGAGGITFPLTFPIVFTPSSGGTLVVTNTGTATEYPILRLYGSISTATILNQTSGGQLAFTGSIADGDYLEIDLFERSILLNGVTNRANLLDVANSEWFGLATGASTLRVTCGSFGVNAKLRALTHSAFVV